MSVSSGSIRGRRVISAMISSVLLAGVVGIVLSANGWKRDLHVRAVRVGGNTLLTKAEILSLAAIPANENIYDLDLYAMRQRIQQNYFVKNADVNRHLSGELTLSIVERIPVATLVLNRLLYIDAEGYVLPSFRPERVFDLPVITGSMPLADCLPGRRITDGPVREALDILAMSKCGADEFEQLISEIHIEPDSALRILTNESGIPVEFGRGDDALKIAMLEGFWNTYVLRRGASELTNIDLRFADQVVVRWNRPDDPLKQ